jgi:hypothetical protein
MANEEGGAAYSTANRPRVPTRQQHRHNTRVAAKALAAVARGTDPPTPHHARTSHASYIRPPTRNAPAFQPHHRPLHTDPSMRSLLCKEWCVCMCVCVCVRVTRSSPVHGVGRVLPSPYLNTSHTSTLAIRYTHLANLLCPTDATFDTTGR